MCRMNYASWADIKEKCTKCVWTTKLGPYSCVLSINFFLRIRGWPRACAGIPGEDVLGTSSSLGLGLICWIGEQHPFVRFLPGLMWLDFKRLCCPSPGHSVTMKQTQLGWLREWGKRAPLRWLIMKWIFTQFGNIAFIISKSKIRCNFMSTDLTPQYKNPCVISSWSGAVKQSLSAYIQKIWKGGTPNPQNFKLKHFWP